MPAKVKQKCDDLGKLTLMECALCHAPCQGGFDETLLCVVKLEDRTPSTMSMSAQRESDKKKTNAKLSVRYPIKIFNK